MKDWLSSAFESGRILPEDAEGFLLGRGMRESTIQYLEVSQWKTPKEPCPDPIFVEKYRGGEYLEDRLVFPAFSPRGSLIGFEARSWDGTKRITDYRLPDSNWNPFFLGLTPETMQKIWEGGNVWIVEGIFDRVLERVIPETDTVLATVRAKLSDTHVEFLRRNLRRGARVYMVYDNDETGQKQTHGWVDSKTGKQKWGAISLLNRVAVPCQAVSFRGGKDPGEIWEQYGTPGLHKAFAHVL